MSLPPSLVKDLIAKQMQIMSMHKFDDHTGAHIAVCFDVKNKKKACSLMLKQNKGNEYKTDLPIGYNITSPNPRVKSLHAEIACIERVDYNIKKRLVRKNLLVIRVSNTGKLGNSKPCRNCVRNIPIIARKNGIIIHRIFYSTGNDDEVVCKTIEDLQSDPNKHVCHYFRNEGR